MSQERGGVLAIQLADGRIVVATPGPEDQGMLVQLNTDIVFLTGAERGLDTAGHGQSSEIEVDVDGHAMTLRLPTGADAQALRKALALGAVTATIVAAGAIAAMQGNPVAQAVPDAPITVTRVHAPGAAPAPAPDFANRRERATDRMLETPAREISAPPDPTSD